MEDGAHPAYASSEEQATTEEVEEAATIEEAEEAATTDGDSAKAQPVPDIAAPAPPDEAAASRTAAAAEIAAILCSPPAWLDGAHDPGLAPLEYELQRGQMPRGQRLAWRWECAVRPPAASPYAGSYYRVLVRIPLGYPAVPPRLSVLSILRHLDVEMRDPHEGDLDETFYEELARRAGLADPLGEAVAPVDGLRFGVGARVECLVGRGVWAVGTVRQLHYVEEGWDSPVPYQVRLDDGRLIFAPADHPRLIRRSPEAAAAAAAAAAEAAASSAAASASGGGCAELLQPAAKGPGRYEVHTALELFVALLTAPLEASTTAEQHPPPMPARLRTAEQGRAWARVAAQHATGLTDAAHYRSVCRHPELFDALAAPRAEWLDVGFAAALGAGDEAAVAAALRAHASEVAPGVFCCEMLRPSFCEALLDELEHYEQSGLPVARPNSMNNYGVILNSIGLEHTMDALQRACVRPLVAALFPTEGAHVDYHHSFMVQVGLRRCLSRRHSCALAPCACTPTAT